MMYRTAAVLAAIGVAIAGCTARGDESTTCSEFTGMSHDERSATIANLLKERNGRNGSTSDVELRVVKTVDFCSSSANRDKTVNDVT